MPTLGATVQDIVVVGFRLFDQALQTDVAPYFDAVLVEGELGQDPGDAAVAVAEGVDAEEVENEGGGRDEGRRHALVDHVPIGKAKLVDGGRRVGHRDRTETDERWSSRPQLDDLVRDSLPLSGVAAAFLK